ncbi:MAG: Gfo/Idh/MocA family oxidoreductase [bacterium]|nr:Gfo/Idh/MocA family oxidoreductase [bacterium]
MDRRSFLKGLGTTAAGLAATRMAPASAAGANEGLTIGVMGGSRGVLVGREFVAQGARVAYACDPDEARMNKAKEVLNADKAVTDFRRILEDPAVDAVIVATPDHWHGPAAILACEAGKHVYVEKPASHNIWEGRLMVEAARRTKRVMQVGSQSRSTTVLANGIQAIQEGAIGEILTAKAWNSQRRGSIGHEKPCDPPAGFDYDLWVGPAAMRPYQKNCHHYTWHWWYDFGTGDAGNDGVHELDIALWGMGLETHPSRVSGYGAKMFHDDDQQFPDTQYVTFEYPAEDGKKPRLIVYEHRIWSPYVQEGHENGNVFYGTEGYMVLAKGGGWKLFGPKNEFIKGEEGKYSVPEHVTDFLEAIRTGSTPKADIEIGHRSAALAHFSNILARSGRGSLDFDPKTERFTDETMNTCVGRTYREGHWAVPAGV